MPRRSVFAIFIAKIRKKNRKVVISAVPILINVRVQKFYSLILSGLLAFSEALNSEGDRPLYLQKLR